MRHAYKCRILSCWRENEFKPFTTTFAECDGAIAIEAGHLKSYFNAEVSVRRSLALLGRRSIFFYVDWTAERGLALLIDIVVTIFAENRR